MEKNIGIIGMPGSGKTTLAEFFVNGKLPKAVSKSYSSKRYENADVVDFDHDITINTIIDSRSRSKHGLDKYDYEQEKEILRNCEIIIYLFDSTKISEVTQYVNAIKLMGADAVKLMDVTKFLDATSVKYSYLKKVTKEIKIYNEYCKSFETKAEAFIVLGTHGDKYTEILKEVPKEIDENIPEEWVDEWAEKNAAHLQESFDELTLSKSRVIPGFAYCFNHSLIDEDGAKKTAKKIFDILAEVL